MYEGKSESGYSRWEVLGERKCAVVRKKMMKIERRLMPRYHRFFRFEER